MLRGVIDLNEMMSTWWMWLIPLAFLAVVIYALNPKRKTEFDAEARVPMDSDESTPGKK